MGVTVLGLEQGSACLGKKPLYAEVPRWRVTQSLQRTSITDFQWAIRFLLLSFLHSRYDDQATIALLWQQTQGLSIWLDSNKEPVINRSGELS